MSVKCKLMRISLKKQRSSLTLNGTVLEDVDEFRDLGLLTNHHLSWNSHADAMADPDFELRRGRF